MSPRVYLETSIISYLVGWLNPTNLLVAHNQEFTRDWWSRSRGAFALYSSAVAAGELGRGEIARANERLAFLSGVTMLDVNESSLALAVELLGRTRIPQSAQVDALHVAVAAVHGMDYLLSWNCKHIVNAVILPQVYAVCRDEGFEPPFICTPRELVGV